MARRAADPPRRPGARALSSATALGLCLSLAPADVLGVGAPGPGYVYTDPGAYGETWEEESALEAARPPGACACGEGASAGGMEWGRFEADFRQNLAQDPDFSGPWVHELCGASYATIWRFAALDPETQQLTVSGTECTAGLASMAAVCAQSAALRARGSWQWQWHEAVVSEEGPGVGDHMGQLPLSECLRHCEEREGCHSLAHGPHGCHLKARCSQPGDELLKPGQRAEGYRTYFMSPCPASPGAGSPKLGEEDQERLLGEMALLLDLALNLAERAVHCLDASAWPFSTAELIANRVLLAEVLLGAGGAVGPAALGEFRWARFDPDMAPLAAGSGDGVVDRALQRARLRWTRRLNSEVGFWHVLLDGRAKEEPLERSEEDAAVARRWVDTGEVQWSWEGDAGLCGIVASVRGKGAGRFGPPRILNTGSGPLAPGPVDCGAHGHAELGVVPVAASDGLARFYLQVFDDLGIQPPQVSLQCPVEELRRCFPGRHFDVVHMRNALDHAMDPLLGLRQMLEVTRPGGRVLLRHARNEGSPGAFQVGLHQWSFDAVRSASGGSYHFMIWNPTLRADVTDWLLSSGLAAEVRTELRPHPGRSEEAGAEDEYIWVDILKPA